MFENIFYHYSKQNTNVVVIIIFVDFRLEKIALPVGFEYHIDDCFIPFVPPLNCASSYSKMSDFNSGFWTLVLSR